MEINTVCISTNEYKDLIIRNTLMQDEIEKLVSKVTDYGNEIYDLENHISMMKKEMVLCAIDYYYIEHYQMNAVIDPHHYAFAIQEHRQRLLNCGIDIDYMIEVITEVKTAFDESREESEDE